MKVCDTYEAGLNVPQSLRSNLDFVCGLECELEGVRNGGKNIGNFTCIKDGSLRGNGYEYITTTPMGRARTIEDFKTLHEHLQFLDKEDPFSFRTSTHVHVNCLSLELEEVRNIVLLYALFEEFFFSMVKPIRRDNIHCVPLTETYLPSSYNKELKWLVHNWHKYTALNLCRIPDLGTIEFRHLHGTGDAVELNEWLYVLENLWKLGQRITINEESLSDHKQIAQWFELIFFPAPKVMALRDNLFHIIHNNLIDVKFSTL